MKKTSAQAEHIPEKKYFRIGEVGKIVGVDTHVLRYWETEFPRVRPHRAKSKQRLYRKKDVEHLLRIKKLLHDEGYTISGARKVLKESCRRNNISSSEQANIYTESTRKDNQQELKKLTIIKDELRAILQKVRVGK